MSEPDAYGRENVRERLEIVDATATAVDRRVEVFEVIAASLSDEAAREGIAELLGVSALAAGAVLDLQARRFTQVGAERIRAERDRLRARIAEDSV